MNKCSEGICTYIYIYMDSHIVFNIVNGRRVFKQVAVEIKTVHV